MLNCAKDYLDDRKLTFIVSTNIAKLATVTSKQEAVKDYWLKIAGSHDFFMSSFGGELIRMVKYSKAFYNSNDLVFDKNMGFLSKWAEEHGNAPTKSKYLISKAKVGSGKRVQYDLFEN